MLILERFIVRNFTNHRVLTEQKWIKRFSIESNFPGDVRNEKLVYEIKKNASQRLSIGKLKHKLPNNQNEEWGIYHFFVTFEVKQHGNCIMYKSYCAFIFTLMLLICPGCINRDLRFIKTEYDFEHIIEYHQPERYYSKDTISFDDYQNIVRQYTKRFGSPIHSGAKKEAMKIYNNDEPQYDDVPHNIWGFATDGEYYSIYNVGTDYLLIIFSSYCGIYLFEK